MMDIEDHNTSSEDIAWASTALAHGRPLDFIASVLGVHQKRAYLLIREHRKAARLTTRETRSPARERAERAFAELTGHAEAPPVQKIAKAESAAPDFSRRRFLLCARFARHWDMIWFLTRCGMSGRSIRNIYGAECLIWAKGGGLDAEIGDETITRVED